MPYAHLIQIQQGTDSQGNRTRTLVHAVDGVSSADEAEAFPGIPQWGSPYSPAEPYLVCVSISTAPDGGSQNSTSYIVTSQFGIKPNGGMKRAPDNPLNIPTRWSIQVQGVERPYDLDGKGRPITSSSREASTQPFSRLFTSVVLTGRRWVRAQNINTIIAQAIEYSDGVVNSDAWVFGLTKGQALYLGGGPVGDFFEKGNTIIEVFHTFKIEKAGHKLKVPDKGFKKFNLDYGEAAGSYPNVNDKFVDANGPGQTLTPIPLNGYGLPFETDPDTKGTTIPEGATRIKTPYGVFLEWEPHTELPFRKLGL